jgi:hypothetical protein
VCMLCFYSCGNGFSFGLCHTHYFVVCFDGVFSFCFDLLFIGYVCNRFRRQLIPDILCSYGRQELLCIIIPVCSILKIPSVCLCDVL